MGSGEQQKSAVLGPHHLPDEILSMVLAFLPLMSILRCRLVGKRWNQLAQEALFRETYARVSGEDLSLQYIRLLEKAQGFAGWQLVASAGDVLLLASFGAEGDQLFVVNPRIATVKRIPPMLRANAAAADSQHFSVVGMVMNRDTNAFEVLAAQEGARPVRFQVYDSAAGAWQWSGAWAVRQPWSWREPTSSSNCIVAAAYLHNNNDDDEEVVEEEEECCCFNVNPVSFHVLDVALHDGALHCLAVVAARDFRILRSEAGSSNAWVELGGRFPPAPSSFECDFRCKPILFENQGRLMLAGAQVAEPAAIRLTVWSYDGRQREWVQVASAQHHEDEGGYPDVCGGVPYLENTFFYLDACGDQLSLGAFPSVRNPEPKVVLYSILQDCWLGGPVSDTGKCRKLLVRGSS